MSACLLLGKVDGNVVVTGIDLQSSVPKGLLIAAKVSGRVNTIHHVILPSPGDGDQR